MVEFVWVMLVMLSGVLAGFVVFWACGLAWLFAICSGVVARATMLVLWFLVLWPVGGFDCLALFVWFLDSCGMYTVVFGVLLAFTGGVVF